MDVILKDGTMITNAKVSDIEEMMTKGIIGNSGTMMTGTTGLNKTHDWTWENEQSDMQKMMDVCNTMCKDNDTIPPQNYTGLDGTNYNAPGMELVKTLMNDNHVINCSASSDIDVPKVNFPQLDFNTYSPSAIQDITTSGNSTTATYIQDNINSVLESRANRNSFDPETNIADEYKKYIDGLKHRKKI